MNPPRVVARVCVYALAIYFFWFAGPGLFHFFTHDDLANLARAQADSFGAVARANILYFSPSYRPLGALFYRTFHEMFSLHPLPSRIFCFAVLLAEFWLIYQIALKMTGSGAVGAVAVLILCYQVNLEPLYYNTGMCYDLFCFLFYWSAFLMYASIDDPKWWQIAVMCCLYVVALNAKEMAVTLPLILMSWQFLSRPGGRLAAIKCGATWIAMTAITIPYLIGKMSAASVFAGQESYRPVISAANYFRESANLLGEAFYLEGRIAPWTAAALFVATAGVAWFSRSKALRFCWLAMTLGILPIAFIPTRGIAQAWIPAAGFGIAIAVVLVRAAEKVKLPAAAAFLCAGTLLAWTHARHGARHFPHGEEDVIESVVKQLDVNHPPLPKGARVLIASDPFPNEFSLAAQILIALYYHDPAMRFARPGDGSPGPWDWVVSFQ